MRRLFTSGASVAAEASSKSATQPSQKAIRSDFSWITQPFTYKRAMVRQLAPTFAADALRMSPSIVPIDQQRALQQHAKYVEALRNIGLDVVEIPAADGCPDSVFIEDTAVVIGRTALITRPGHESRRPETAGPAEALARLGYNLVEMAAPARLDGGDVLFTGRELFVGLSHRTNRQGAVALAAAFPGVAVTPVPLQAADATRRRAKGRAASLARMPAAVAAKYKALMERRAAAEAARGGDTLHLKSVMSMCAPNTVALVQVADTPLGHTLAAGMGAASHVRTGPHRLRFAFVPDAPAANMLLLNGAVVHRDPAAEYPASAGFFSATRFGPATKLIPLDMSELAKADGALSCCSLLLHH